VTAFVVAYRAVFGVTAICRVLGVPVASVRSSLSRPVPARVLADEQLKKLIFELFEDNYSVYGRKKLRKALRREHGLTVDKDRVGRLMGELGIRGVHRSHQPWTTKPDVSHPRAPDLVKRRFVADRPNQLWVSDFTYVSTWSGFVYVAFIVDVYSRMIVGWRVSTTMTTSLVMDALEHAIWTRKATLIGGVIAHSDAGSQYTSVMYTERLAEIGAQPSIGTVGDSYDNAMAEAVNALYKTELTKRRGPWRTAEHLETETMPYIVWFNNRRLHSEIGDIPPAEFEANYYAHLRSTTQHPTPPAT
jgi:putative transposase